MIILIRASYPHSGTMGVSKLGENCDRIETLLESSGYGLCHTWGLNGFALGRK